MLKDIFFQKKEKKMALLLSRPVQEYCIIEGFHDAVRTPCALRADAMLDIFCVARYRKNQEKITKYALISYLFYLSMSNSR